MIVNIAAIKIRKRVRKENRDIDLLAESLAEHGLLNPILLNHDYELIAGFRRLDAAKKLGWETIAATIIDVPNKIARLELELEENVQRLDFTNEELLDGFAILDKLKNPTLFYRILICIKEFFSRAFDKREAMKADKKRTNGFLSLLILLGIGLMTLTAVFYKNEYISGILLALLNVTSFVVLIVGLFFFIRFCRGMNFKKNSR